MQSMVVTPPVNEGIEEIKTVSVYEMGEEDWRQQLIDYLKHGKLRK